LPTGDRFVNLSKIRKDPSLRELYFFASPAFFGWLSHVLEADLPSPGTGWAKADAKGGAGVDLLDGSGEPDLVSATQCFFAVAHDRRCVLHCNVTKHPTSLWVGRRRGFVPQTAGVLFLTIDSVDCIIDTTGLPELMPLTPRRNGCPRPQYFVSNRFAACWNERPECVASRLLLNPRFIGRTYPVFRRD
jgi:hypothetical protein